MQSPSQEAWNRLRSLIKSCLTFAELKDAAGSAGLEVDRLAHLQQKSLPERGASKSQLLDEIGRLFAARDEPDRIEILETFTRECLRKFPSREAEFGSALRRSGIILTEKKTLYVYATEDPKPASNPVTVKADSEPASATSPAKPLVFVSYSRADAPFKKQLEKHLKALTFHGKLSFWTDDQIPPGAAWFHEIKRAMDSAAVAVLLVTGDFLASDFIRDHEFQPILDRYCTGSLKLIWIPVRACNWRQTPLRDIQTPISPDKPIAEMKAERDKAWVTICEAIAVAANTPLQPDAATTMELPMAPHRPPEESAFPQLMSPAEELNQLLNKLGKLRSKIASCPDTPPTHELEQAINQAQTKVSNVARDFRDDFYRVTINPQPAKFPPPNSGQNADQWPSRQDLWPAWDLINTVIDEVNRIKKHPLFQKIEGRWRNQS